MDFKTFDFLQTTTSNDFDEKQILKVILDDQENYVPSSLSDFLNNLDNMQVICLRDDDKIYYYCINRIKYFKITSKKSIRLRMINGTKFNNKYECNENTQTDFVNILKNYRVKEWKSEPIFDMLHINEEKNEGKDNLIQATIFNERKKEQIFISNDDYDNLLRKERYLSIKTEKNHWLCVFNNMVKYRGVPESLKIIITFKSGFKNSFAVKTKSVYDNIIKVLEQNMIIQVNNNNEN